MVEDVILTTRVRLLDPSLFLAYAQDICAKLAGRSMELAMPVALLRPTSDRAVHGIEVLSTTVACSIASEEYVLTTLVRVHNTQALRAEAKACYGACWGDADWSPATVGEAAYEVLLASNANPSPCDMGFEFIETRYEGDVAYVPDVLTENA
jgi:hypothetical protein